MIYGELRTVPETTSRRDHSIKLSFQRKDAMSQKFAKS